MGTEPFRFLAIQRLKTWCAIRLCLETNRIALIRKNRQTGGFFFIYVIFLLFCDFQFFYFFFLIPPPWGGGPRSGGGGIPVFSCKRTSGARLFFQPSPALCATPPQAGNTSKVLETKCTETVAVYAQTQRVERILPCPHRCQFPLWRGWHEVPGEGSFLTISTFIY